MPTCVSQLEELARETPQTISRNALTSGSAPIEPDVSAFRLIFAHAVQFSNKLRMSHRRPLLRGWNV